MLRDVYWILRTRHVAPDSYEEYLDAVDWLRGSVESPETFSFAEVCALLGLKESRVRMLLSRNMHVSESGLATMRQNLAKAKHRRQHGIRVVHVSEGISVHGKDILLRRLTEQQRHDFLETGSFMVTGYVGRYSKAKGNVR